jgi:hypothetical protein
MAPPLDFNGPQLQAALMEGRESPVRHYSWRGAPVGVRVRHDFRGGLPVPRLPAATGPANMLALWKETVRFARTVDGVVFVADSQTGRREANLEALRQLRWLLEDAGRSVDQVPVAFQLNKRDVPAIDTVEFMRGLLRTPRCGHVQSVATVGLGVMEAFAVLLGLVR